jgi:hypothetical protein
MPCKRCGELIKFTHKTIVVDALWKEYTCKNGHITVYKRYKNCLEINGKVIYLDEYYSPKADRSET